ncbi:MAG: CBS domain-containing protein [Candidatus Thermoplasmatota archaeon]|jgi:CBS domain-containing protein|nr:CBS domain-containing protein [Candidatus Thermoplasmatota archaeon]
MERDILVKEAMKTNLAMVKPTITVLEAAKLMKKRKIGNVLVVEKKQPIGILTESDILKKVVAEGLNAKDVIVKDIMSTPIIVIDPYINLEEAMKIMGKCNIRRLPVVENGELIGIITQKDISAISPILHDISREWYDIKVRDEAYYKKQIFSGKCEDCGTLSSNLKNIDGRLLCEDCADVLKYE